MGVLTMAKINMMELANRAKHSGCYRLVLCVTLPIICPEGRRKPIHGGSL